MSTKDNGVETENTPNSPENPDNQDDVSSPSKESQDENSELSRRKAKAIERDILEKQNQDLIKKLSEQEERLKKIESKVVAPEEKKIIQSFLESQKIQKYNKDIFEETKKSLEKTMSPEKAIKYAMMEATEKEVLDAMEESEREEGRRNNSLAPRVSSTPTKQDDFPLLSKKEFGNLLTNKVKELGEKAGQKYYQDYCKHQESKGRGYYTE